MRFSIGLVGEYPPTRLIELVQLAEQLGFSRVWLPDERFQRDVFVNLTLAALHTRDIGIGCLVTDPYIRHPAITGVAAASVDEISGYRLTLGLGAGINGFKELDITRRQPARAMKEAISLIRSLTKGEQHVTLEGDVIKFRDGQLDFKPARPVPIMAGGRGPKMLQVAGEVSDEVLIGSYASPRTLQWALNHVTQGAQRTGRNAATIPKMSWLYTAVASSTLVARDAVRHGVAVAMNGSANILQQIGVEVPRAVHELMSVNQFSSERDYLRQLGGLLPSALLEDFSVSGTVDQVVAQFTAIGRLGINEVGLWVFPTEQQTLEEALTNVSEIIVPAVTENLRG